MTMRSVQTRHRTRARGFTLPELMAVVAIVGVMGAIAMSTMSNASSSQNAAALARSLQFAMMNARTAALSDGYQHRLNCYPATIKSYCQIEKMCVAGMNPVTTGCASVWTPESKVWASQHASLWSISSTTDTTAQTPAQSTVNKQITFYPDGSATASTLYVSDENGSVKSDHYKVYVYSATGMARLVNQW
jgi:prepilin-type N-terminal cleavage/methylation domain-containing protein